MIGGDAQPHADHRSEQACDKEPGNGSQKQDENHQPTSFMTVRDETAKTPRETGTRSPERPRRT